MKKLVRWLKLVLLLVVVVALLYATSQSTLIKNSFAKPEALRSFLLSFGILAPLILIFLQIFQTVISIIPSEITTIVAGFLFGPVLGILYNTIGTFIGSFLVFLAGRKYGKALAGFFLRKKDVVHFNLFFQQRGLWALFLARVAPFFPNDVISFAAGLTSVKAWQFNLISTLGFLVEIVLLTFFGAELARGKLSVPLIIIGIFIVLLLLVGLFKEPIRKLLIKNVSLLEKEGQEAEKFIEKEFRKL